MGEQLTLRFRGTWQSTERLDTALVGAVLIPFGAELLDVIGVEPGEVRLLIAVPETVDLIALGAAVGDRLGLASPRITFERETSVDRGIAGSGYYCSCGGVDGDHADGCPRAVR